MFGIMEIVQNGRLLAISVFLILVGLAISYMIGYYAEDKDQMSDEAVKRRFAKGAHKLSQCYQNGYDTGYEEGYAAYEKKIKQTAEKEKDGQRRLET